MKRVFPIVIFFFGLTMNGCIQQNENQSEPDVEYDYELNDTQTHARWSSTIEPVLTVPSGSVIKVTTQEASAKQLDINSTVEDLLDLSFDPIHPLTGPVYIEGAEPGDILRVTLHKIEMGDWGWTAIIPGFGFLTDEFDEPYLKTYKLGKDRKTAKFSENIEIPLKPFPGVMGVAPDTEDSLSTIPPRANGGNMDDPNMTEGSTIYFPVFVEGALFSIGDAHAAQGHGEVCGTAIEAPMEIIYEVEIIKNGRKITEPQYETDDYYAVTAFAETIDEASRKATRFMVDYLQEEKGLSRNDAYALCSLAGDLKIAEVVDVPHMLVSMHISKDIFLSE